jgi:hypothetical protein
MYKSELLSLARCRYSFKDFVRLPEAVRLRGESTPESEKHHIGLTGEAVP